MTNPPQARVFVDNIAVGQTQPDGWLLLEGVQSGNHRLRITHDGFQDWESDFVSDGKPQQVVVNLNQGMGGIPRPPETMPVMQQSQQNFPQVSQPQMQQSYSVAPINSQPQMHQTSPQNWQTGQQGNFVHSQPPARRGFSPLILAIIGIAGGLILISGGLFGAYKLGLVGGGGTNVVNNTNNNPPVNSNSNNQTPPLRKADMVKITGGKFTMGRNDGTPYEIPEHEVEVKDFWMDKTEVTNNEYYEFITEAGYNPPKHFENGKPVSGDANAPVRFVSVDDVNAFAEWRSKRDKVTYRLPTEEEWEYAARNGSENNLYPWGDKFEEGFAIIGRSTTAPEVVGSKTDGANKWGVLDLIGNVWEWTSSKAYLYPGSKGTIKETTEPHYMVRGGAADQKTSGKTAITSTFRVDIPASRRDAALGFRLVRSD